MGKKVLIAMSGGVDSSAAAFLMKQAGYDCIGVTMKLFQNEDIGAGRAKTCCFIPGGDYVAFLEQYTGRSMSAAKI